MFKGRRLQYAAIGCGLVVAALLLFRVLGGGHQEANVQDRTGAHTQRYYDSYGGPYSLLGPCPQTEDQGNQTACDPHYYERRDLQQQRNMSRAAWAQLTLTGISIALLLYTLGLSIRATNASIAQAKEARRAIPQPYLQLKPGEFKFAPDAPRTGFLRGISKSDSVKFRLHNYGPAVATLIHIEARLDLLTDDEPFPGLLTGNEANPDVSVHGTAIGAQSESEIYWVNRKRREGESGFDSLLDDWFLHGFAVYSDGFDRYYALGFCYSFAGFGWSRDTPPGCRNGDANYHRETTRPPARPPWLDRVWRAITEP